MIKELTIEKIYVRSARKHIWCACAVKTTGEKLYRKNAKLNSAHFCNFTRELLFLQCCFGILKLKIDESLIEKMFAPSEIL